MTTVRALYPHYFSNSGVGHTCLSVCQGMRGPGFEVLLTVAATEPSDRRDFIRDAVPPSLRSLSCRRPLHRLRYWCTQRRFLNQLSSGGIAYIWPGTSRWVYEEAKRRGHILVMERINCHRATAGRILDEAYDRLGWPAAHGITEADTTDEQQKLQLADLVFCPSPLVRKSMLDAGLPARKLLLTSYGWEPRRLQGTHRSLPPGDGITVIFVGLACVRKGVHLLLQAWEQAKIKGRLLLVGDIASDIAERCADQLNRPDVLRMPYCDDVAALYRSADLFAFPTLEEGSPLVSYEALACGLPLLTSPMGAGEIVRDGIEGVVLEPYDDEGWVQALRRLADDRELRESLSDGARLRAQAYTWAEVGQRRRALLNAVIRTEAPPLAAPVVAN